MSLEQLGRRVHVSRSYLSKLERGKQPPSRQIAVACDRELDVCGALIRAWETADGQVRGGPRGAHVSKTPADVSNTPGELAEPGTGGAPSEAEGIYVPCRLDDGRVVFVSVDRRTFLRGGVGLGATAAIGAGVPATAAAPAPPAALAHARSSAYGPTPIQHLRMLRRHLIDSDNLLGPGQALPAVHQHITVIQQLRQESGGADRDSLLELQTQFAEFASWLHHDLGDHRGAEYWLDRALQWSHTVGDADLTCFVMARKSQLAGDARDLVEVVDLAEAARKMARPRSRLEAVGRTYAAYGHALRGEASQSERAFDQARDDVENLRADPSPWGVWLDASYVEVYRAQGLEVLGKHSQAAAAFSEAIRNLPDEYHRDRGVYLAREAVAHAGAGIPEQAAAVGLAALVIAQDTGSGRIFGELTRLGAALRPWKELPEVAEFRSAFKDVIPQESS
jgi:tetratricopeptide (TPR) repeat protein